MAQAGTRGQRNFLGDFEAMLKALSLDYVDCARYETSGYAEFIGKLYAMNPSMFQSPIYCDHTLTQMALHYLSWFQDPAIRFEVGPNASWHVDLDAWKLQRYGDELYVIAAPPESGIKHGERIVAVNGSTPADMRPEVERLLRTTVEPADPEREDWSVVLAFAKHATVQDESGTCRTVSLVPGESAVTDRMRKLYAKRTGQETHADEVHIDADPEMGASTEAVPACSLRISDDVCVLRLSAPGNSDFSKELVECLARLASSYDEALRQGAIKGLVIDVRGAQGGAQEDIYPLVNWILAPGTTAAPADLFGKPGILLNCSRRNVAAKLDELAIVRSKLEQVSDTAALAELDALASDLATKRGAGLVAVETDFYPAVTFSSAQSAGEADGRLPVVILTARDTSDAAEWLVRAAKSAGYARIAGRATRGSIDNTCLRTVKLDNDFSLTFPTARYLAATGPLATLGRGIAPDVRIPWTPAQLTRDVEFDEACKLLEA